jgi:hypothetical protein
MDEPSDLELHRNPSAARPAMRPSVRPIGLWIAVTALALAAGGAFYVAFGRRPRPVSTAVVVAAPTPAAKQPAQPLGGRSERVSLPALDASDTFVKTLVQALSESPAVMTWLSTKGLIRNFTVVVANIADGVTPAAHLKVLRPSGSFRTIEGNRHSFVDPRGYGRYSTIADAIASVDPARAAKLYATLKPRIEEAHRELGSPDASFDRTLERAIVVLLKTPIVTDAIRLKPKGIGYAFADVRLESLTAAQKQLLRMGPRNVRIVKERLRWIAMALGIPPDHLPAE